MLQEDEMMLITRGGQTLRCAVKDIRETGRVAQGVQLKKLDMGDVVAAVARLVAEDKDVEGASEEDGTPEAQMELTEGEE
jgi:DNA gyrase subunit A